MAAAERPLFAATNLGTRLVVAVHPDITVGSLKKKLGREHSSCFPYLGEIKVHSLLVKRKIHQYHLSDSMPIWNAFHGLKIAWFLVMDVSPLEWKNHNRDQQEEKKFPVSEDAECGKREKGSWLDETPRESSSERASITAIISNYFPDFDDVDSCSISSAAFARAHKAEKHGGSCIKGSGLTSASNCQEEFPIRVERFEVGRRLVLAGKKIGGEKLPRAPVFVSMRGKPPGSDPSSSLCDGVFDISDSDD